MSKTKIIKPSEDAIAMVMWMEKLSSTGAYETVNSTTSSMDYASKHVMEYR